MGVSTDGQICFGIALEEDTQFPWDTDEHDGDIEHWWIYEVHGYKSSFELFGPYGEWLNGVEPPASRIDEYYDAKCAFKAALPSLPIELVLHCSGDYPMYILAVPRTVKVASRGYPEEIKPDEMVVTEDECNLLIAFCEKHNIEIEDKPRWWLSSLWG